MNNTNQHVYALILAGGGGTRLWPQSRNKTPKQFLKLAGNVTMLQKTAERFSQIVPWDHIFVIANQAHQKEVTEQLPEIPSQNIIFEPAKKDTALAMLVGALYIGTFDPEAVILNGASDHVVVDEEKFTGINLAAAEVAKDNSALVSVGITPTGPSTAFGYIKVGSKIKDLNSNLPLYKVDSFTEKPDEVTAKNFIATGQYYWNANNYVWSLPALLAAFDAHFPKMSDQTKILRTISTKDFASQLTQIYDQVEPISIDYAISEKAQNLVLIPGDFGWNDIGEWKVVYELSEKDAADNVVSSDSTQPAVEPVLLDSKSNMIHTDKRLIALLGVDDMIVVDTKDIVLVAPKSRSQDVKKIVEKLKAEGRTDYL